MSRYWLYWEHMFMPSIGRWAKILFSDIRDDLHISDSISYMICAISVYRTLIHGKKDCCHVGCRFVTLFTWGRSLLAVVMTPSYRTYLLFTLIISSHICSGFCATLITTVSNQNLVCILTPMMPTVKSPNLSALLNCIAY